MTETTSDHTVSTDEQSLKLPLHRTDGTSTGDEIQLDPRLFGLKRNDHVLYLAVKTEMANRRQGSSSSKTRSEVRGGGRKPFNQKGRGAARAGTIRSPIWRGGGVTFGPRPHEYLMKLPRKVKRLARRVALSVKAQSGAMVLVEDFEMSQPKTAWIASVLKNFEADGKSALLLVQGHHPDIVKSCRNIPRLEIRSGMEASAYDILRARRLIICRSVLDGLAEGLINEK
ncbi:MAG: 50S ribosomal protein L4 [Candidatus Electryoneaceae bacterium]|nr:50S ribosomal protein L4 [Candidatus Electryoneaceae bacterium]